MLYEVVHATVPPAAKLIWRPHVEGLENIPPTGPVILASNHLSFADSIVIPFVVRRRVAILAKRDYFIGTGIKGALIRGWFEGIGMVPVDRDDIKSGLDSLNIALDVLGRVRPSWSTPRVLGRGTDASTGAVRASRTWRSPRGHRRAGRSRRHGEAAAGRHQVPRLVRVTVRFGPPLDFRAASTACRRAARGAR